MDARMKRIAADYEQIKKDFADHRYIEVIPEGAEPPEKYRVIYHVNGIYLDRNEKAIMSNRHEVEITLHADYPRYKPICKILTPIWHPNFRDGQICIGDIWGAGESLSDIIVNIGDMIQYKSWNSSSPLSADAAAWAVDHKGMFPVGDAELNVADPVAQIKADDIVLYDDSSDIDPNKPSGARISSSDNMAAEQQSFSDPSEYKTDSKENDFEITAEDLKGIEFVPAAHRMQGGAAAAAKGTVKVKINFKTVLVKGILWALLGAVVAFGFGELEELAFTHSTVASMMGYGVLSKAVKYKDKEDELFGKAYDIFRQYCKENNIDPNGADEVSKWVNAVEANGDQLAAQLLSEAAAAKTRSDEYYAQSLSDEFSYDTDDMLNAAAAISRVSSALWSCVIALFIGLFLGIGEGVYYGSKKNIVKYALIGAIVSLVFGFISGFFAQWLYASMLSNDAPLFQSSLIRGVGWAILGIGVGAAAGLIKPSGKRVCFCAVGGLIGAFIGGFVFNYVAEIVPNSIASRGVGIVIMGILIGVGIGLLEQFAKSAWLKVTRGEFEGKEYLVFPGTTSIGNGGGNTIVLFKDKLVGEHHCDILLKGTRYVLQDCGTPMGTLVNGVHIDQHILQQGDQIALGNSVLVFNSK